MNAETFKQRNHKDDWSIGVKTNQEFLLMVNKFSSRSFNDVSQYPIFPWVVKDFKSSWVSFTKKREREKNWPEIYRDFSIGLGSISKIKTDKATNRYDERLQDIRDNEELIAEGLEPEPNMVGDTYGDDAFQQQFGYS